jgi:hypothetical protein
MLRFGSHGIRCAKRKRTPSPRANAGAYLKTEMCWAISMDEIVQQLVRRTRSVFKQSDYTVDSCGMIIRIVKSRSLTKRSICGKGAAQMWKGSSGFVLLDLRLRLCRRTVR